MRNLRAKATCLINLKFVRLISGKKRQISLRLRPFTHRDARRRTWDALMMIDPTDWKSAPNRGYWRGFGEFAFYGVVKPQVVNQAINQIFGSIDWPGRFASDNMVAWGRALSFLDDEQFVRAFEKHAQLVNEKGILWRTHTMAWAARSALRLPEGDLVECGTYRGTTARIVSDLIGDAIGDRRYWLYDTFEWNEGDAYEKMDSHDGALLSFVQERFADAPFTRIVPGYVPQSFEDGAPDKVALLHIDLNNVEAEAAAMEFFWDRLVDGALVIFDDFGWWGYLNQRLWHEKFAAEKGHHILEMPTGQGLLIKQGG